MASRDSATVSVAVVLDGVWLHSALDPEGTARNFRYGKSMRSEEIAVADQESFYAGRTFPVVDVGDNEIERVRASVVIPHDEEWRSQYDALRALVRMPGALVYRDGRGRLLVGRLSGYQSSDQDGRTQASFQFGRTE